MLNPRTLILVAVTAALLPGLASAQAPPPPAGDAPVGEPAAPAPISLPVLLGQVYKPLPEGAMAPGDRPATVVLELVIDEDGAVVDQVIATPSGNAVVDQHALTIAPLLEFLPARQGGEPVLVTIQYPFRFFAKDLPPPVIPPAKLGGMVEVKGSKEPAPFVTVDLYPATPNREEPDRPSHYDAADDPIASLETGEDGLFSFDELPPGSYVAILGGGSWRRVTFVETLAEGATREVLYRINPTGLNETVVVGRSDDPTPERVLTRDELWKVPGAGGDVAAAIAALPGVVVTAPDFTASPIGDQTPVVRGAASEDSVFALDGLPSPLLLHSLGGVSIVDNYVIEKAFLQPAAAEARYGDLTGGVVGIDIRSPRADRIGGFVQPGVGQASAAIEGPITKKSRFYIGFKRSYFDLIIRAVLPKNAGFDFATFPYYQDQQALLQVDLAERLTFDFNYFGTNDGIRLLSEAEDGTTSDGFSLNSYMHRWQIKLTYETKWGLKNVVQPAVTTWGNSFRFGRLFDVSDRHTTIHLADRLFVPTPLPWLKFNAGVLLEVDDNKRSNVSPPPSRENQAPTSSAGNTDNLVTGGEKTTRVWVGGFAGATFDPIPQLSITPEFRFDWFEATKTVSPAVRGRMAIRPTKWLDINFAGGRYVQSPSLDELNSITGNPDLKPENAWHVNAGVVIAPVNWLSVDMQGYAKFLDSQVVAEPAPAFGNLGDLAGGFTSEEQEDDPTNGLSNSGLGRIYGAELFTRFGVSRGVGVSGWFGYSLSWAERKDKAGDDWRWFQWDRRHQITAVARVTLPLEIGIGARWQMQTGAPVTPIEDSLYLVDNGFWLPQYGELYSVRRKPYHQLDIRLDKRFRMKTHLVDFFIDVTNVYYAKTDQFPLNSFDYRETASFALIPTFDVGVRVEF